MPSTAIFPLPAELILDVAGHCRINDLNAFMQTCRQTYCILEPELYREAVVLNVSWTNNSILPSIPSVPGWEHHLGGRSSRRYHYLMKTVGSGSPALTRLLDHCPGLFSGINIESKLFRHALRTAQAGSVDILMPLNRPGQWSSRRVSAGLPLPTVFIR